MNAVSIVLAGVAAGLIGAAAGHLYVVFAALAFYWSLRLAIDEVAR